MEHTVYTVSPYFFFNESRYALLSLLLLVFSVIVVFGKCMIRYPGVLDTFFILRECNCYHQYMYE
jgi:hypothetical protein